MRPQRDNRHQELSDLLAFGSYFGVVFLIAMATVFVGMIADRRNIYSWWGWGAWMLAPAAVVTALCGPAAVGLWVALRARKRLRLRDHAGAGTVFGAIGAATMLYLVTRPGSNPTIAVCGSVVVAVVCGLACVLCPGPARLIYRAASYASFPARWSALAYLKFTRSKPRHGCCQRCGYDLRKSSTRCPECGAPIIRRTPKLPPAGSSV